MAADAFGEGDQGLRQSHADAILQELNVRGGVGLGRRALDCQSRWPVMGSPPAASSP
ncbi:MAG: hypothetical protein ACOH2L_13195 [Devosia sp.]